MPVVGAKLRVLIGCFHFQRQESGVAVFVWRWVDLFIYASRFVFGDTDLILYLRRHSFIIILAFKEFIIN